MRRLSQSALSQAEKVVGAVNFVWAVITGIFERAPRGSDVC